MPSLPGVFSREIKVHCWACSSTGSPKSRCSIVLGFQYSLSLDEVEVEDEMSTGSISGPDDKPSPVFGSGGGVVGFGGVSGRFPDDDLGGGKRHRFGGAAARRIVSS